MDIFSRLARSWLLIRSSAAVLRSDSELLILPFLSGIAALAVGGALIALGMTQGLFVGMEDSNAIPTSPIFYVWLFVFYFLEYFVVIFFNTALVGAAIARLSGGDPTVSSAIALAASRIGPIIGYALISATVGVILRMVAERLGVIGRLIESGLGLVWTVATFLVVPILAAEGIGPVKAISRSTELLGDTWGENLIGNSGISVITSFIGAVIALFGFGSAYLVIQNGNLDVGIPLIVVAAVATLALVLVSSALSGIYSGAVYYFALTGDAPRGFDVGLIRDSFTRKEPE
jgi:Family of unknown function (DUF6159)